MPGGMRFHVEHQNTLSRQGDSQLLRALEELEIPFEAGSKHEDVAGVAMAIDDFLNLLLAFGKCPPSHHSRPSGLNPSFGSFDPWRKMLPDAILKRYSGTVINHWQPNFPWCARTTPKYNPGHPLFKMPS